MKFSVIVPLYNKAAYVEKALRSVFAQTFKDWELIVVDDGSTDNSLQVAKHFLEEASHHLSPFIFHILPQENAGVSTARNNGVAASHGDYVCFLDADDWWSAGFLEEMDGLISKYPDAGIYGTNYYIVKNARNRVAPIAFDDDFEHGYVDYVKTYSRFLCMPLWTGAVCVSRNVFDEMHGFKAQLKLGEDFDLWLRIALKYRVAMVNKPLAYYNQDVPAAVRATRNLHKPENTEYILYSQYETENEGNSDLKALLDKKRVETMLDYFLSDEYCDFAKKELEAIDWSKQPRSMQKMYSRPKWFLKAKMVSLKLGSKFKQLMKKTIQ